nr:stage III sporulation protein AA [Effusibacillus lacus]
MFPAVPHNRMEYVIEHQILPVLAPAIRKLAARSPQPVRTSLEEIRIRQEQPVQVYTHQGDYFLDPDGQPIRSLNKAYRATGEDVAQTVQLLTRSSLYAWEEELRRGYVTIAGGHRVGLAGKAVLTPLGSVQTLKHISCINIRIAREIQGAADGVKQFLTGMEGKLHNTLIISPPQSGKTTLLRDIARQASDGLLHPGLRGMKVGVVDERSELAGCVNGIPQHSIGARTDVLDACPKAEGMLMMIRSMSPQLLITDEIGREQDRDAILEAVHSGVAVIASAHGLTLSEVRNRPAIRSLFEEKVFSRYIVLSRRNGPLTLEGVYDKDGQCLFKREGRYP